MSHWFENICLKFEQVTEEEGEQDVQDTEIVDEATGIEEELNIIDEDYNLPPIGKFTKFSNAPNPCD